ncbi:MAG: glycoside hydrolase family 3 N-terminal domain-containing protein [Cyanobacteriota bacterium]|nr:glycoside hydrolase family 3 N-terminal domain-containing protein [Cyanobacteriota bacterium]
MAPEITDLRRQVAQLLVVRASGHLADHQRRYPRWELANGSLRRLLAEGVGGVILLGGSAAELGLRTRQLVEWAQAPLLLCADVEEGVGQRFEGASWLVPPLALGRLHRHNPDTALALARRYGACTAREARAVGLNWLLAPVCDVNNNPANPVINVRAWGEDPATVAALACAFLEGAQTEGVLTCAKHFPGHGDTSDDSHLELPLLPHDRARLEAMELPPFRAAITAGVASVMTAHLLMPSLDVQRPATLSPAVLTGLLREQLGFGGLIVTDALVMEAIAAHHGPGDAAVLALEAGADLVLMPADAEAAIAAIVAAVQAGRLAWSRLEGSLERRQAALAAVATGRAEPNAREPLPGLGNGPAPQDQQLALELVRRSLITSGGQLPIEAGAAGGINLLRVDNLLASGPILPAGAPALDRAAGRGWRPLLLDHRTTSPWGPDPQAPLDLERLGPGPVLLQLFIRGNPFRGTAGAQEPWGAVLRQLLAAGRLAGLVVYGSPYLWESLAPLLPAEVAAGWSPGQMPLAQGELLAALGWGSTDPTHGGFTD